MSLIILFFKKINLFAKIIFQGSHYSHIGSSCLHSNSYFLVACYFEGYLCFHSCVSKGVLLNTHDCTRVYQLSFWIKFIN